MCSESLCIAEILGGLIDSVPINTSKLIIENECFNYKSALSPKQQLFWKYITAVLVHGHPFLTVIYL